MYFVVDEYLNGVREDEPAVARIDFSFADDGKVVATGLADVGAVPCPLADGSTDKGLTLAWVDVLCIAAAADEQKKKDAGELIEFFNDEQFTKRLLVPEYGQAPRYLLPARAGLYADPDILKAAPLYATFKNIMDNSL